MPDKGISDYINQGVSFMFCRYGRGGNDFTNFGS
ncbi:Uncharacterised protein [Bartonella doshiae]|uniref:Uncharacterized protein n=1 Tax=Bartonella doshiae TaxID=33044 RepID=A0A380ZE99_BARDO|nr:Uncharacterised protein [Bartonella doshiae]